MRRVVAALAPQVSRILLLDNSDSEQAIGQVRLLSESNLNAEYVSMEGNRGLGAAYNRGLVRARQLHANHVLLMDQDSLAAPDLVAQLLQGFAAADGSVVTLGPTYTDQLSNRQSVVLRSGCLRLRRVTGEQDLALRATEMLISSGSLIPITAFDDLGEFDEALFIDHIDTDWALRVQAAGRVMLVAKAATMQHQLGDRVQRIWLGRWHNLPVHNSERLYYIVRNSLLLYRRSYAHWRWILFDLQRLGVVALVHLLAPGQRGLRMWRIGQGICAGLLGVKGKRSL